MMSLVAELNLFSAGVNIGLGTASIVLGGSGAALQFVLAGMSLTIYLANRWARSKVKR